MAAVLAAAAASLLTQPRQPRRAQRLSSPAPPAEPIPADAVHAAFDAARAGDAGRYLQQFTDPLRAQLIARRDEEGSAAFSDYLRASTAPVKGLVTREWQQVLEGDEARLPVEFVFAKRNEVQTYRLRRLSDGWRIVAIETAAETIPPIPYGAPVKPLKPPSSPAAGGG